MNYYRISAGYKELIEALLKTGASIIAPVLYNKVSMFRKISSADEVLMPEEYINTVRSAKEKFFPVTEPLVKFKIEGKDIQVRDIEPDEAQTIIVGLRPCDAAAFNTLDLLFSYEYKDKFYIKRRENTTIISVACSKCDEACFCTSFGIMPDSLEGSDIQLKTDQDGKYYAETVTEKGKELASKLEGLKASETEIKSASIYSEVKKKIRQPLETDKIKSWLDNNFDSNFWDEYSARCLGCASCAFLCPTCHCFDIVDEMHYNKGFRRKNWDACQFPVFTKHSSGHNPRDIQSKRYRQRVMHKFKYFSERFNKPLCTGCGRCVRACPVNLDIYEVASATVKY